MFQRQGQRRFHGCAHSLRNRQRIARRKRARTGIERMLRVAVRKSHQSLAASGDSATATGVSQMKLGDMRGRAGLFPLDDRSHLPAFAGIKKSGRMMAYFGTLRVNSL